MRKLIATLGLAVLLLGACGGGNDNKSTNANASSDTTEAAASGGANFTDFCGAKAAFGAGASATAPDPNAMKNAAANLDKAVQYAPSEIKGDVKIVADAFRPFLQVMASVNYDFTKLMSDPSKQQQIQALSAKFNEADVKAASDRINAYVTAHCK
jgi:hypothetical protein